MSTELINVNESVFKRYESKNIFVSLLSDNNNEEYLISIGAYTSESTIVELHDLKNNNYKTNETKYFLGTYLYATGIYSLNLFALNNKKEYLLSFLTDSSCFLNILSFSEFELKNNIINSYERNSITTSSKVVNCFQMNDNIILFYLKSNFYYLDIYN